MFRLQVNKSEGGQKKEEKGAKNFLATCPPSPRIRIGEHSNDPMNRRGAVRKSWAILLWFPPGVRAHAGRFFFELLAISR
jgi:hypothetical protein